MVKQWKPNRLNKNGIHVRKVNKLYVLEWLFDQPIDMDNYAPLLKLWAVVSKRDNHGLSYNCESGIIYGVGKVDTDKLVEVLEALISSPEAQA